MRRSLRKLWRQFLAQMPVRFRAASGARPAVRDLQRWHNRVVMGQWPASIRVLTFAAEEIVWPLRSAWEAWFFCRKYGRRVQALSGSGRGRQWAAAWRAAVVHRLRPYDYYHQNFWQHGDSADDYLLDGHLQHVFRALNRGEDLACMDDKQAFWRLCCDHHLATPPVLAILAGGRIEMPGGKSGLSQDLFFKPRFGFQGLGAARWSFDPATGTYASRESAAPLGLAALLERYRELSRQQPYLVQPCLRDHPAIADVGNGTLCVIRMITAVRPDGTIGEFASILKAPMGPTFLTNLADGALFSPIDSARGTLRAAFTNELGKPAHDCHPHSGVRVAGRPVPHWREAVELACSAHRLLAQVAVIGWDVALTPSGPCLLEGNHGLSITPFNIPPNPPLGRTELPALLVWHLQRKYGTARP